jgi:hypothetical protein
MMKPSASASNLGVPLVAKQYHYTVDCDLRHKRSSPEDPSDDVFDVNEEKEEVEERPRKRMRVLGETDSEDEGKEGLDGTSEKDISKEEIEDNINRLTRLIEPLDKIKKDTSLFKDTLRRDHFNADFQPCVLKIENNIQELYMQLVKCRSFYSFLLDAQRPVQAEWGYFGMLPPELLLKIFSFLDGKDLAIAQCTCTFFRKVGSDESLWKTICEGLWSQDIALGQKPANKPWRWLFDCKMHTFKRGEEKNGSGQFTLEHNNVYEGEWKKDKRHGRGTGIMADGRRYDGEWEEDMRSGFGIFRWPTTCNRNGGDSYAGYWKDSKRHGPGVYTWVDGTKYDGQWKDGKREGTGTVIWPDGRRYDGEYKDGKMEGKGTFTWPDGSLYEGEYKAGRRHGFGTYTYRQAGGVYKGEWKGGNRDGWGTLEKANGDTYKGNWKDNQPNGWGVMSYANGQTTQKIWHPRELSMEP